MHYYRWRVHGDANHAPWTKHGEPLKWLEAHVSHEGDECLTWPFATQKGYGVFRKDGKNVAAHREMCERKNGPAPTPDHDAAHSCGKGHEGCIHPGHLIWKTRLQNLADKIEHGTDNRGEKQWNAKLTSEDVRLIRQRLAHGDTCADLGELFNVTHGCIRRIKLGKTWAWLEASA